MKYKIYLIHIIVFLLWLVLIRVNNNPLELTKTAYRMLFIKPVIYYITGFIIIMILEYKK